MTIIAFEANIKDRFFDREKVVRQIGRANVKRLSKMGAYVQRRARTAILRRGPRRRINGRTKASPAGQPPYVWSRDTFATLRNILFGLDRIGNAVLIGPRGIPSLRLRNSSASTVPQLLEHGGSNQVAVDPETAKHWGTVRSQAKRSPRDRYVISPGRSWGQHCEQRSLRAPFKAFGERGSNDDARSIGATRV